MFKLRPAAFLLLLLCALSSSQPSYAGFIISRPCTVITASANTAGDSVRHRLRSREETFREGNRMPRRHRVRRADDAHLKSGWAGIVALVFACTFYYGPLAILFGAIGMQKGRRNRGLAKGAFIAGLVETLLIAAIVVIALAAIGI